MPTVEDVLVLKQHRLHSINACANVLEATQLMNECGVGAVVITDHDRMVGIFTERDVLRRVVALERSPRDTRVADVMTAEVLCCDQTVSVEEAREIMMLRRIRHLPICDDEGCPLGMISIGDLNAQQVREQQQEIGSLHDYIYGRA